MKNTTLFLVFIISMITSWLLFSILWNFFDTNHTYIEVLRRPEQLIWSYVLCIGGVLDYLLWKI
jgi:hypothetical protein